MAKLMNHELFDCVAIKLAEYRLISDAEYQRMRAGLREGYAKTFRGDETWLSQAEALIPDLISFANSVDAPNAIALLKEAFEIRSKLTDDMKEPSRLRSVFGGTLFSRSHPDQASRPRQGLENCKRAILAAAPTVMLNAMTSNFIGQARL
jgi:hypothetical protein